MLKTKPFVSLYGDHQYKNNLVRNKIHVQINYVMQNNIGETQTRKCSKHHCVGINLFILPIEKNHVNIKIFSEKSLFHIRNTIFLTLLSHF